MKTKDFTQCTVRANELLIELESVTPETGKRDDRLYRVLTDGIRVVEASLPPEWTVMQQPNQNCMHIDQSEFLDNQYEFSAITPIQNQSKQWLEKSAVQNQAAVS